MAKRGAPLHPKTKALARKLQIMPCHALGLMESLWHVAFRLAANGLVGEVIEKFGLQAFAEELGWTGDPQEVIDAFVECGLLDQTANGPAIHDWSDHADDAVNMALARKGELFWDGKRPKNSRLSKKERVDCEARFREAGAGHADEEVRSLGEEGTRARTVHTASALPSPPLPTHSKPNPSSPAGRTVPKRRGSGGLEKVADIFQQEMGGELADRFATMPNDELKILAKRDPDAAKYLSKWEEERKARMAKDVGSRGTDPTD